MEKKAAILITVCVEIIVIVFFEFFVFITPTQQSNDPYSTIFYDEFNRTPTPAYNYLFSPPVSMYHALLIALESGGWNATSLENMTISAELDFCAFSFNSFRLVYRVTSQPVDWSPQQVNDTTYRYVWTIIVGGPGSFRSIPPPGYHWVDAATGELVPTGIL
jgi:hypothetical protein